MRRMGGIAPPAEPRPFRDLFTAEEEDEFIALVRARFPKARGYTLHASDDDRWMTDTKGATYGLSGLARRCKTVERSLWKDVIADHCKGIEAAQRRSKTQGRSPIPFDDAAPLLAVRLHAADDYPGDERAFVCRSVLPGIIATVVLDYPESAEAVSRDLLRAWKVPEEAVFERALQNVRAKAPLPVRRITIAGQTVYGVEDNVYWYTATHALLLDAYPDSRGPYGRLFAIPNRHLILLIPIRSAAILNVINAASAKNVSLFREMPGPISPHWFWEDTVGTVHVIKLAMVGDPPQISITPPPEFVSLIEKLPQPWHKRRWVRRGFSIAMLVIAAQLIGHQYLIGAAKSAWQRDDRATIVAYAGRAHALAVLPRQRAEAAFWMGVGEYRQGNLRDAEAHEREAIRLVSNYAAPHVTLGAVLQRRGDRNGAWIAARRAVELDPDYAWAQNLVGMLLVEEGKPADAAAYFRRAVTLDGSQSVFSENLANAERIVRESAGE